MEAQPLLTVDDLLAWPRDARIELIAYALDGGGYRAAFTAEAPEETAFKARTAPIDAIGIDLDLLVGSAV
jgi:hypothetical protein